MYVRSVDDRTKIVKLSLRDSWRCKFERIRAFLCRVVCESVSANLKLQQKYAHTILLTSHYSTSKRSIVNLKFVLKLFSFLSLCLNVTFIFMYSSRISVCRFGNTVFEFDHEKKRFDFEKTITRGTYEYL